MMFWRRFRDRKTTRPGFELEELEPRRLFSADPLVETLAGVPPPLEVPAHQLKFVRR